MASTTHVHHLDDIPWKTRPGRTDGVRWKLLIATEHTPNHGVFLSGKN